MEDERYTFNKVVVIKAIIENSNNQILLIKEPDTNEWMPGRWGLPGGKPYKKESLYDAFKRKMKEELGKDFEPSGIFRIEELLINDKSVYMVHVVVKSVDDEGFEGEAEKHIWAGVEAIQGMSVEDFTEFFNKKLLLDYLSGSKQLVDFDLIETQNYYDLHESEVFNRWLSSKKKDE